MSKRAWKLAPGQGNLFEERVIAHLREKEELLECLGQPCEPRTVESYEEALIELAAACKRAQRKWGKREDLVAAINAYFGWDEESGRSLSIHMLNHYFSKPTEYVMPSPLIFAIQHITGSLEPCRCFAEAEGGDVISKEEKQLLMLGKMEAAVYELNKLKRELKNGGR